MTNVFARLIIQRLTLQKGLYLICHLLFDVCGVFISSIYTFKCMYAFLVEPWCRCSFDVVQVLFHCFVCLDSGLVEITRIGFHFVWVKFLVDDWTEVLFVSAFISFDIDELKLLKRINLLMIRPVLDLLCSSSKSNLLACLSSLLERNIFFSIKWYELLQHAVMPVCLISFGVIVLHIMDRPHKRPYRAVVQIVSQKWRIPRFVWAVSQCRLAETWKVWTH